MKTPNEFILRRSDDKSMLQGIPESITGSLTTIAVNDHQQNRNKQHQSSKESAGLRGHDFGDACLQDGDKFTLEPGVTFEPEHVSWAGMG